MENAKKILITGAGGNLGGRLTKLLADSTEFGIVAVSSFPERIPGMIERECIVNTDKIIQMSSDEMFSANLVDYNIVGAVHFAFSRAIFPNKDIADSLDYSLKAFRKIADSNIQNAIYVSSQSVYGDTSDWRTEETVPAPGSLYAMAKYAGEKIFEAVYAGHDDLQHTIVRLDYVIQSQNLVKALCKNAKQKGQLSLKGGKQAFSYLDVSDVPRALYALLESQKKWQPVYNVGPDKMRYNLVEIAQLVKKIARKHGYEVSVSLTEDDTELWAGIDAGKFISDTGWRPEVGIEDMIENIFQTV